MRLLRRRTARASPRRWSLSGDLSKVLAQMRLIYKSTAQRDVTKGCIRLKHVLSCQLDPTPNYKGMGGVPERSPEGARKMRFAALHKSAQIRD